MNICLFSGNVYFKENMPELRSVNKSDGSTTTVMDFTLNADSNVGKSKTFVNCQAWGKLANDIHEMIRNDKGAYIILNAEYAIQTYKDTKGYNQYKPFFKVVNLLNSQIAATPQATKGVKDKTNELREETTSYTPATNIEVSEDELPF